MRMLILAGIFLFSCAPKKAETDPSPVTLTGKWKSVRGGQGYFDGGDFKWHTIASANAVIYQFNGDSSFTVNGFNAQCFPAKYKKLILLFL